MKIQCPSCAWSTDVPDEKIPAEGAKGTCPKCQTKFEVKKEPLPNPDTLSTPQNSQQDTKPCPLCGEEILSIARKCKHCNSMLDGSPSPPIKERSPLPPKSTPLEPLQTPKSNDSVNGVTLDKKDKIIMWVLGIVILLILFNATDNSISMVPVWILTSFYLIRKKRMSKFACIGIGFFASLFFLMIVTSANGKKSTSNESVKTNTSNVSQPVNSTLSKNEMEALNLLTSKICTEITYSFVCIGYMLDPSFISKKDVVVDIITKANNDKDDVAGMASKLSGLKNSTVLVESINRIHTIHKEIVKSTSELMFHNTAPNTNTIAGFGKMLLVDTDTFISSVSVDNLVPSAKSLIETTKEAKTKFAEVFKLDEERLNHKERYIEATENAKRYEKELKDLEDAKRARGY